MFRFRRFLLALACSSVSLLSLIPICFAESAVTDSVKALPAVIATKDISLDALRKYPQTTIETRDRGVTTKYTGVPLRLLLAELIPDTKLDSMPEWKALTRRGLVLELKGKDGFPSLVTVTELAINKTGDRFILAIEKDGKALDVAPQLICQFDEARVRCVRDIVTVKIFSLQQ